MGGTAINLFIYDMPRVSVDIDLSYIPVVSSVELQKALLNAVERFKILIEKELKNVKVTPILGKKKIGLLIKDDSETEIKMDFNTGSCGSLGPIAEMTLQQKVYKLLPSTSKNLKMKLLPKSQIIAGKLSACHKVKLSLVNSVPAIKDNYQGITSIC